MSAVTVERATAPIHPSGEGTGQPIEMADVLAAYEKPIVLSRDAVVLVGSVANQGRSENDVDLVVRDTALSDSVAHVARFRLGRAANPELSQRLSFHADEEFPSGVFTDHVPLYDLVLMPRQSREVVRMRHIAKQDDPLLDVWRPGPRPMVAQLHFRGRSVHLDLRFAADERPDRGFLIGWTVPIQKPGTIREDVDTEREARAVASGWTKDDGNAFLKPALAPSRLFASPKSRQPLAWLDVVGRFDPGEVGACLLRGAPIITKRGIVPIESVRHGDQILGRSGSFQRVREVGPTPIGERRLIRLRTTYGATFFATEDHPMLVTYRKYCGQRAGSMCRPTRTGGRCEMCDKPVSTTFMGAGSLAREIGGRVRHKGAAHFLAAFPKPLRWVGKTCTFGSDRFSGEFLGLFVGDGWIHQNGQAVISFGHAKDWKLMRYYQRSLEAREIPVYTEVKNEKGVVDLFVDWPEFTTFASAECYRDGEKCAPLSVVMSQTDEFRDGFVEGLVDADGYRTALTESVTSASQQIVHAVMLVDTSLGRIGRVAERQNDHGLGAPGSTCWVYERRRGAGKNRYAYCDGRLFHLSIAEAEFVDEDHDQVWNLSVEGDETFSTLYWTTHNTRNLPGFFLPIASTKKTGMRAEQGIQEPFFHEYFLVGKPTELAGTLIFRQLVGERRPRTPERETEEEAGRVTPPGEAFWTFAWAKNPIPSVLRKRSVERKRMPPPGRSWLPQDLEKIIPREFQYWRVSDQKKARAMRDALVAERFLTEDNVRVVNGSYRRVVTKSTLYVGGWEPEGVDVEKRLRVPYPSFGGSAHYASRLVGKLPKHARYVEPFAGSAAVFFRKTPAAKSVLADADSEIVFALKYIQGLTKERFAGLKRFQWKYSRGTWKRARNLKPKSDAERFWRHVYGRSTTWGGKAFKFGYSSLADGRSYNLDDLWKFHAKLKGVTILQADWRETLRRFDGRDTLFFVDPPYEGEWEGSHGTGISPTDFAAGLKAIKGMWVAAYKPSAKLRRSLPGGTRVFSLSISETAPGGTFRKRPRMFATNRASTTKQAQRGRERRPGESIRDCVSRKIPVIIREKGVSPQQAAAIAHSLCGAPRPSDKQARTAKFTLSWQFFRGQQVVRTGPSRQVWWLVLDDPGKAGVRAWKMQGNPITSRGDITAVAAPQRDKELLTLEGNLKPGTRFNPTKATPSTIRILDRGTVTLLEDRPGFVRVQFNGKRLKDARALVQEETGAAIWELQRSGPGGEIAKEDEPGFVRVPGLKDRDDLRPLQRFTPMKPADKPDTVFFQIEDALARFASGKALRDGVFVEPKWNGFRLIVEKKGDQTLLFFEDTKKDKSGVLPSLVREIKQIPGDFILDAELLDTGPRGRVLPRRTLTRFAATDKPKDDSRVIVPVFHLLFWSRRGNLTNQPLTENRKVLEEFFRGRKFKHLRLSPSWRAKTPEQLRVAVRQATRRDGSEGAMFKLALSTYSLGGETSSWAKLKVARTINAIVVERVQVKERKTGRAIPGVFNFIGGVGPLTADQRETWDPNDVVRVGGKPYAVIGKTFNAKAPARVGDIIEVSVIEMRHDTRKPDRQTLTWFQPRVVAHLPQRSRPDTVTSVLSQLRTGETQDGDRTRTIKVLKAERSTEERYVLGIVLEPEVEDSQDDIYSIDEIRQAAHGFMEDARRVGEMHRALLRQGAVILENYLAPADVVIDGQRVKKGTWLLGLRIKDDRVWSEIRAGRYTGLSIGGSALRVPDAA